MLHFLHRHFYFNNVSLKVMKTGKKGLSVSCDANSHSQKLRMGFRILVPRFLLPEDNSSLRGALVKCPQVLKDKR